jgi:hypothetical protein
MHSGTFRIVNDATNYWGHVQAFATQRTILQRIGWADPFKSYAEWAKENKARQALIDKDIKEFGYRTQRSRWS